MMRMSGRVLSCCAVLFLALASVSAIKKLDTINDLKKINFGQYVPKHTLLLLYWFANVVNINSNNIIQLTFDPNNADYGSHHYGNFDELLGRTPYGYKYYTVGNLLLDGHEQLPDYVTHPQAEYAGRNWNWDRIIFRVRLQTTGWERLQQIDQVYITQHYGIPGNTTYDPDHTYEITTNLLRQIREFSVGGNQQLDFLNNRYGSNANLSHIRNIWGNLAGLGLLLFIVTQERLYFIQQSFKIQNQTRGNTPPPIYHGNFQQTRQVQADHDISGPCMCLLILVVILFVILFCIVTFK